MQQRRVSALCSPEDGGESGPVVRRESVQDGREEARGKTVGFEEVEEVGLGEVAADFVQDLVGHV